MNTDEEVRQEPDDTPAQQAWNEYIRTEYLDRMSIIHAHRAFIAGFEAGRQRGIDATLDIVTGETT